MLNESEFAYTHDDYKQIIPAPIDLYSSYSDEDGNVDCIIPIVCIALKYNGEVVFLNAHSDGEIDIIDSSNLIGLCDGNGNSVFKGSGE